MNYESMIDSLDENTQMDFLENALEVIDLNEGFDVGGKIDNIKKTVMKFFDYISQKITTFIAWVKKKLHIGDAKANANAINAALKEKPIDLSGENIKLEEIHKNRVIALLTLQDEGINDIEKISRIAADNSVSRNKDRADGVREMHEKYQSKVKELGLSADSSKSDIYNSMLKNSTIGKVTSATVNSLVAEIDYTQKLIDSANAKANKFNAVCKTAKSNIAKIPNTKDSDAPQLIRNETLKKICSDLMGETRLTFNVITKAFKTLVKHKSKTEATISKIKAKISTPSKND